MASVQDVCVTPTAKYTLDTDYVEAVAGSSPIINFTVTSEPPLAEGTKHSLTFEETGNAAPRRFMIRGNCITLRNVRSSDSGAYIISCCNEAGEGKETFELDVTEASCVPKSTCDWEPGEHKSLLELCRLGGCQGAGVQIHNTMGSVQVIC